ncbi:hypothetical protein HY932_00780 [Candidatus Falkowbacteria bacterium]|nr:hypothetical protein [Candidatus Falkowbacteria bacterium]
MRIKEVHAMRNTKSEAATSVLERAQAPPKQKPRDIFSNVQVVVTKHAMDKLTKDVKTLPKDPAAVVERLLRGARMTSRSLKDKEEDIWRFRNKCFDFVVALQVDAGLQPKIIVVTCWQRRGRPFRPRSRDERASEKHLFRRKLKAMNLIS